VGKATTGLNGKKIDGYMFKNLFIAVILDGSNKMNSAFKEIYEAVCEIVV
jgi:hypothetical protein